MSRREALFDPDREYAPELPEEEREKQDFELEQTLRVSRAKDVLSSDWFIDFRASLQKERDRLLANIEKKDGVTLGEVKCLTRLMSDLDAQVASAKEEE